MTNELELNLTPLMKQYQQIKQQYKDCILLFRLGDFYEMFGEDAIKASPILGVVLTKRQEVPMCGVPFHSVNNYISKLINQGFKVAICEQVEDPKLAKGIIKREVTRIITPGTILEDNLLEAKKNNFLTSIDIIDTKNTQVIGLSTVDISTGDFLTTQFEDTNLTKVIDEINRISPSEIVAKIGQKEKITQIIKNYKDIHIEFIEDWYFDPSTALEKIKQFYKIYSLDTFGINSNVHYAVLSSIAGLFEYLERTQKSIIPKLKGIKLYSLDNYMFLNTACIRNLEIVENLYDRSSKNTLLSAIDLTNTPMGARLLRSWLLKPLIDIKEINKRQLFVELFYKDDTLRQKIREKLKNICDIERITNKISTKNVNPKDLLMLKESLDEIPKIKELIKNIITSSQLNIDSNNYSEILLNELKEISQIIQESINPDAPVDIKKGNVIKPGYNKELDEIKNFYSSSKEWLLKYQEEQKTKTNIQSLKVGYTSVFGYYIEVTKANIHLVPKEYIRKQTLKNVERFTTPELKEFENKILIAEEKISQLEEFLFNQIIDKISDYTDQLHEISYKLALIDIFSNLAEVAKRYNYTKPIVDNSYVLELKSSRHPVIEQILPTGKFIPNDVYLDGEKTRLIILTGPNMAGKSTYIRQVALCVILAQIGSFVPAEYARVGIVDKIFARIGASDYLAKGLSTFMVEMQETANILHNATERSLIILDEIGRGTSTYDGISIAWAVIEHLTNINNWPSKRFSPKTLFATHYFELTELEEKLTGVKNYNVSVKEYKDEIIFLYKVVEGSSDKSYGIHVAKLAGIPKEIVNRAYKLLKHLQDSSMIANLSNYGKSLQLQLNLENISKSTRIENKDIEILTELLEEIKKIDINNMTPIDAFNYILKWKRKINTKELKEENIKD